MHREGVPETRAVLRAAARIVLLVAALSATSLAYAEQLSGRVVGVADGDTVTVLDAALVQHKVRLAGIDAPEKSQPFGNRSKQSLSELVFQREVVIEYKKNDRYGRIVGKVSVGSKDAGLEQVKRGMAWHYKRYMKEQPMSDRQEYAAAEESARAGRIGLWADKAPVPPWEFRHPLGDH